jgi:hypothetical protein
MAIDAETTCHCGAGYGGSNHCPDCGCERSAADCGQRPNPSLLTCFREATGEGFRARLRAAREESRARARVIEARNCEVLGDVADAPDPGIERQERKAQVHEIKAGKTFRRTKKHLRKAWRHQAKADRLK